MSCAAFPAALPRRAIAEAPLLLGTAAATPLYAQSDAPQPQSIHLRVATCSGSTGHGSAEPWKGSHVQQNEDIIWTKKDKHAQAYSVLSNERSKRSVANLGHKAATAASPFRSGGSSHELAARRAAVGGGDRDPSLRRGKLLRPNS